MRRTSISSLCGVVLILTFGVASLSADRVKLRSGKSVVGLFMSADVKTIRVLLDNGSIAEFQVDEVTAVEFAPRTAAKAPPPASAPAAAKKPAPPAPPPTPDPAKAPAPVTIPMGTVLNVRLTQTIDVDSANAGMTFKSLLDDPVMVGGQVVLPRGAAVVLQAAKVEQAGKMKGADKITLKANSVSLGGRSYDITTTYVEQKGAGEGKKTARKVGGGAGLGAIVGGIAGGGTGAAIGAAAGAATGAIISSQGTDSLKVPAETRLQFSLSAAVTVQP
jgi:hypothetical protein